MKKRIVCYFILFFCVYVNTRSQDIVTSITLEPTPAYLRIDGQELRMVRLLFNGRFTGQAVAEIQFNGLTSKVVIPSMDSLKYYELPLPGEPIKLTRQLYVRLITSGNTFEASAIINPSRKWQVYIMPHSHVDIGYNHVQADAQRMHTVNVDYAIELGEKTRNYPEGSRHIWNLESNWVVDKYLEGADKTKEERFWNAVKKGWINISASYANINTGLLSTEGLLHAFEYGAALSAKHGIPINNMYQGDIPGATWGIPGTSNITGIKYFLLGPNDIARVGNIREWENKPFYWVSPSGKDKVLFLQCHPYNTGYLAKGQFVLKDKFWKEHDPKPISSGDPGKYFLNPMVFDYLNMEENKGYPYDMMLITWALCDNAPVDMELPDAVMAWNEKFASPKLVICSAKDFFTAFEQKYKRQIPEFKGDMTDHWIDGVGSDALSTALNRTTSEKLQQVEVLWSMMDKKPYPASDIENAWKKILLFAEHTWGSYNSISEPDSAFSVTQWRVKKSYVVDADHQTNDILNQLKGNHLSPSFELFNTTGFPLTDLVTLSAEQSHGMDLVVDKNDQAISSQRLSTGELVFVASNLPPFSGTRYTLKKGTAQVILSAGSLNEIENEYYKVVIDLATASISTCYSKKLQKNMVGNDKFLMNQYLYITGDTQNKLETTSNTEARIIESGNVLSRIRMSSDAPGCQGKLTTEITLIKGVDRVEIKNVLDKKMVRAKEAVHFSFPFSIPSGTIRYDIPSSYVTVESDLLPGSCKNWFGVQRWIDISNADYGVTWSSLDAPLVEFDTITANLTTAETNSSKWLRNVKPSSTILSWVMNNYWYTNFKADQEGVNTFRYAFRAHTGSFNAFSTNEFGVTNAQPLMVCEASGRETFKSLFAIEGGNGVYIAHIKPSADGKSHIVSVSNTGEKTASFVLRSGTGKSLKYLKTNLAEDKLDSMSMPISIAGKELLVIRVD